MGNPGAPSLLCSAVGQRARSERVLSTLDPSSGPAATIKCWHVMACTQGRDLFEANGVAPWHAARVVGSNTLRESAARAQLRLDSGSTPAREDARLRQLLCSILRCGPLSNAGKECGCSPSRCDGIIAEFVRPRGENKRAPVAEIPGTTGSLGEHARFDC